VINLRESYLERRSKADRKTKKSLDAHPYQSAEYRKYLNSPPNRP
jgi:hypothetical protein